MPIPAIIRILAWGLYDLANQFFAVNIVSLYFVRWLVIERQVPEILYSITYAFSVLLVGSLAPFLGYLSDTLGRYRVFLVWFTLISVAFTAAMAFTRNIFLILCLFAVANFATAMATVFYNSLMANVVTGKNTGLVSGIGRMLGYSGAVLSLYLMKPIVLKSGYHATFLPTAVLFLLFALPCMLLVKDKGPLKSLSWKIILDPGYILGVFRKTAASLSGVYKLKGVAIFFKTAFFSLCAVNAVIIYMGLYATRAFQMNEAGVVSLIAFSTLFAILGSLVSGWVSDYLGTKLTLAIVYALWFLSFSFGACVNSSPGYFLVGSGVGLALGSTWVVFRAMALGLVGQERRGEIFGLFNLSIVISGIAGTLWWGLVVLLSSMLGPASYRLALLSLNIFILIAAVYLSKIESNAISSHCH